MVRKKREKRDVVVGEDWSIFFVGGLVLGDGG